MSALEVYTEQVRKRLAEQVTDKRKIKGLISRNKEYIKKGWVLSKKSYEVSEFIMKNK